MIVNLNKNIQSNQITNSTLFREEDTTIQFIDLHTISGAPRDNLGILWIILIQDTIQEKFKPRVVGLVQYLEIETCLE